MGSSHRRWVIIPFLKIPRILRLEGAPQLARSKLDDPNEPAGQRAAHLVGRRSRQIDGILESTGNRLVSPCTSRTIVAAPRTLSVPEMFASLLRALGNWDAAKYLWRRHRVLQKPRLPMTHTIQDRTLNPESTARRDFR